MDVVVHDFFFPGKCVPAPTASVVDGPWSKADTSTGGAPTLAAVGGLMVGTLAADEEAENLALYFGDVLGFDIDDLIRAEFWIKASASFAATDSLAFGMASARNDAIDSIAAHALFRLLGDASTNPITCETDDGTNDNDDKAAGQVLVATLKRFVIDFAGGVLTKGPPSLSVGGKGNVLFSMDDPRGNLVPVCRGTLFDMSNYSAGLQPFIQIQKTSATTTPSFSLRRVRITEKFPV